MAEEPQISKYFPLLTGIMKKLWFVYMRVIITVNIGHMVTLILISTHMFH